MYVGYARVRNSVIRCPRCHGLAIVSLYANIYSENVVIYRAYCKSLRCKVRYFTIATKDSSMSIIGIRTYTNLEQKRITLAKIIARKYSNGNDMYKSLVYSKYVKLCKHY